MSQHYSTYDATNTGVPAPRANGGWYAGEQCKPTSTSRYNHCAIPAPVDAAAALAFMARTGVDLPRGASCIQPSQNRPGNNAYNVTSPCPVKDAINGGVLARTMFSACHEMN
jgi:hypothetical protein